MEVLIPFEEIVFLGKWNLQQSIIFSNYSSQNGENSSKKLTDWNHEFGLENAFSLLNNK